MISAQRVLSIRDLSVNFGGLKALSNVNIDLHEGEVLGLIGPNGAGKTTVFNALSGLVEPASGSLELYGRKSKWLKPHQLVTNGISRTLQGVGLFPDLTVLENVMMGAQQIAKAGLAQSFLGFAEKDEERLREEAQSALERVYVGSLANRRADTLAYPDTKRVAIARALVSEPKILLLDEPAGGLGPQDIEWLNGLIRNIKSQISIIIVEHHMDVVMSICDRISVLNFGELIASGSKDEVRNDPDVIAAYLGSAKKASEVAPKRRRKKASEVAPKRRRKKASEVAPKRRRKKASEVAPKRRRKKASEVAPKRRRKKASEVAPKRRRKKASEVAPKRRRKKAGAK